MSDIRFRTWIKSLEVMADVLTIDFEDETVVLKGYKRDTIASFDQIILLQYTGFKDKKGKEIYVGDYIKYLGKTYRVVRNFTGAFVGKMKKLGEEEVFVCYIHSECEVIGNIYENKEENK